MRCQRERFELASRPWAARLWQAKAATNGAPASSCPLATAPAHAYLAGRTRSRRPGHAPALFARVVFGPGRAAQGPRAGCARNGAWEQDVRMWTPRWLWGAAPRSLQQPQCLKGTMRHRRGFVLPQCQALHELWVLQQILPRQRRGRPTPSGADCSGGVISLTLGFRPRFLP